MLRVISYLRSVLFAVTAVGVLSGPARANDISVFAAASLGGVLDAIAQAWTTETGGHLTPVLAGSSAIARQIQAGAPADFVILANPEWMDVLQDGGDIDPTTRRDLLTNRLVLIGHGDAGARIDLTDRAATLAGIGDARVAVALTEAVPAGIYARAALDTLGLWSALRPNIVETDNVRAALALVAAGAAPFGIVYATDAAAEPRVSVLAEVPADSHPPILYPAAAVAHGDRATAHQFLQFLSTPTAQAIFTDHGFGLPAPVPNDG